MEGKRMSGVREIQKADRERRILKAAESQFRKFGYELTRIDNVALEAGLSVGTIYNYFDSKCDLLLTLVTKHDEFISREIDDLIKNPPNDLVRGVCGVFLAMTRHSLDHLGKENWRHLFGVSIAQRHTVLGERFAELNERLLRRIIRMLSVMQSIGFLAEGCDIPELGRILHRVETMLYIDLASNDDMSFSDYNTQLIDDIRFVLTPYIVRGGVSVTSAAAV